MLSDFNPSEVTFPPPSPRFHAAMQSEHHGWETLYDDAPAAPRRAPRSAAPRVYHVRSGRPVVRSQRVEMKKRLLALKRTVRTSLRLGRCPHALAEWRALAGSTLPGAKKAARQLKKSFTNKCMRVPRNK